MNIRVSLPIREIEKTVNQSFGEVLFDGKTTDGDGGITYVQVFKKDRIRLSIEGEDLVSSAAVHVKVRIQKDDPLLIDLIKDLSNIEKTDFDITVRLRTRVTIGEDWNLKAESNAEFTWDRKPAVGVGFLKVKVSQIVQPILEKEMASVAQQVDDFITQSTDLRGIIADIWKELHQPIQIEDSLPVWLMIHPEPKAIRKTRLKLERKRVSLLFFTWVDPVAVIGPSPSPLDVQPLPGFAIDKKLTTESKVDLWGTVSYQKISQIYADTRYELDERGQYFHIRELNIQGSSEQLQATVNFEARLAKGRLRKKVRGRAELTFIVNCDPDKGAILVDIIAYQLRGSDLISRLISQVYKKSIIQVIEQSLNGLIKEEIEATRTLIRDTISQLDLHLQVEMRGILDDFVPREVAWDEQELRAKFHLTGAVEMKIRNL